MAIKIVDIGIEGNDGTGDSIRTSFDKVNQNFQELYAVFGQGGQIKFTDLSDVLIPNVTSGVPPLYTNPNKLLIVDESGTKVTLKPIAAKTNTVYLGYDATTSTGTFLQDQIIVGSVSNARGKIVISQNYNNAIFCDLQTSVTFTTDDIITATNGATAKIVAVGEGIVADVATRLNTDPFPTLISPLNAANRLIGPIAEPTTENINNFNSLYGTAITAANVAIPRSYADSRYVLKVGDILTGELYLSDHPLPLEGFGTPNGSEDLQAATRFYVDNDPNNYSSVNLYVSTTGSDNQRFTVFGREGKSWKHALSSINQACQFAEYLTDDAGVTVLNIIVEAGAYSEQFPIKVPKNVKIYGKNVTISPATGSSTSKWVTTPFYRDTTFDGLTYATTQYGYHYLTTASDITSTSKTNALIDAFLLCDNTEISGITLSGSSAFLSVLHPSAITSVPKITDSTVVGALSTPTVYGGAYVDGFAGNQILSVSKVDNNTLTTSSATRKPIAPGYFINSGTTYTISSVTTDLNTHSRAKYLISKNYGFILDELKRQLLTHTWSYDYVKWTNTFRDILVAVSNDIQYGSNNHTVLAARHYIRITDNGTWTTEHANVISMLTLMKSLIASVISNTPITGLTTITQFIEAPADTNYTTPLDALFTNITDIINKTFSGTITYPTHRMVLSTPFTGAITSITVMPSVASMYFTGNTFNVQNGYGIVSNNLAIAGSDRNSTSTMAGAYANNGAIIESTNCSSISDIIGLKAVGINPNEIPNVVNLADKMVQVAKVYKTGTHASDNTAGSSIIYVYNHSYVPYNFSTVEINHGNTIGIKSYPIQNVTLVGSVLTVYFNQPSTNKLAADLVNDQFVIFRSGTQIKFTGVNNGISTRPATALTYLSETGSAYVYRALGFGTSDPLGNALPSNTYVITTDNAYRYPGLVVDLAHTVGGYGKTIGDTKIAVSAISDSTVVTRLNSGKTIFGWNDTIHSISAYTTNGGFSYITISPGLTSTVDPSTNATLVSGVSPILSVGLTNTSVTGTIVVGISNIIATGHRFKNATTTTSDVTRGKVFHESSDQNGTFSIGSYFSVDQGTGIVTISSAVNLTNVYGLQFYRGVTVSEFTIDDSFSNLAIDSVPTTYATGRYIDRRLGLDKTGAALSAGNIIGPGFLDRAGTNAATANLNLGGFRYTNAGNPSANTDLTTKLYVDLKTGAVTKATAMSTDGYSISAITPAGNTATITTSVTHSILQGKSVTIAGTTGGTGASINGDWVVQTVGTNTFTIYSTTAFAGTYTGGTVYYTGTASFNSSTFTVSSTGFVQLANSTSTTTGITLPKMRYISEDQYLGRSIGTGSGVPSLISSSTIVTNGGAILNAAFTTQGAMFVSTNGTQLAIGTGASWTGSGGAMVSSLIINLSNSNVSGLGIITTGVAVAGTGIPINSTVSAWNSVGGLLTIQWPVSQVITTTSNVTLTFTAVSNVYNTIALSSSGTANSIARFGSNGEINAQQLKLNNSLVADIASSSTLNLYTPGSPSSPFFTASGSTPATTTTNIGGNVAVTGDFNSLSDANYKENVITITGALDKVCNMRGVYYTKKLDPLKTKKVGVIAQEVLTAVPEAVVSQTLNGDTYYGVEYGNLVGVLIEAIKELKAEIVTLKTELGK